MTEQKSEDEANKTRARPDTARLFAERLPCLFCGCLAGMSVHSPEMITLSIEADQFGTSQWIKAVLQTEVRAAGCDVVSSHHDADLLATTATQVVSGTSRLQSVCWPHSGIFHARIPS